MIRIVYMSSATAWPTQADLEMLLQEARERNAQHGITGLLLYRKAQFLQVLEGPEAQVRDLFETISRDRRHTGVVVVFEQEIDSRSFGDWHMGFQNLDDQAPQLPGFADLFGQGFDRERLLGGGDRVVRLMRQFVDML